VKKKDKIIEIKHTHTHTHLIARFSLQKKKNLRTYKQKVETEKGKENPTPPNRQPFSVFFFIRFYFFL
jgi:hypothetical protein